ncbi:putative transcriptional regulator [Desulfocapsa sulfexigens DSM 10523]|uniref:Putative transcriptional regulator n=1 Tax=Desulfocapsa sulfexigens (strain DSM 10523 / SB164P1) TaxID=1167006 RepID=M1NBQ1_DESSD|nr:AlpA family transcriptional regulator [Desulfocapsa sulfexigens]AGF77239.1 putative transcriptional regulator [Desulfocapsa sulfexigens DSM 10523]
MENSYQPSLQIRLLRRPEVEAVTGLKRSTIYARIKMGTFPAPVQLGPKSVAWKSSDIQSWIEGLPKSNL